MAYKTAMILALLLFSHNAAVAMFVSKGKHLAERIIYILLDGLAYNTRGYFASCIVFF